MGSQRESAFEKKFIKELRKLPRSWWPDKVDSASIRGIPDRVGCVNGRTVALEFKKSFRAALAGSTSSNLQEYTLNQITAAGGFAVFCWPENAEAVYAKIKGIAGV